MDFEVTRFENDEQLLSQLESIKTAQDIRVLIPFAKAYLGMYYVIDSKLAAKDKVKLLANTELAEAIFIGFVKSLKSNDLPSLKEIGHAAAHKKEFAEGYVVLAGLDIIANESLKNTLGLNTDVIDKAIGFHFTNISAHKNIWFLYLLEEETDRIIFAISQYWQAMLNNNTAHLPGRNLVLGKEANIKIIENCILMLLQNWSPCKARILFQLLYLAFKYSKINDFLITCEQALKNDQDLNEKTRLYWILAAYLIAPEKYFAELSNYVGRAKLKTMYLLDFVIFIMKDKGVLKINISDKVIAQLLRMTAPVFPPQHHVYGTLGALDINSRNVMKLFYRLASATNKDVIDEIKLLRKVRVMKKYSDVIKNLLEIHAAKNKDVNFSLPDYDTYIKMLAQNNCLQGRSSKFDLR